jgi:uncharacterized protein YbjT (DUF2867 family)
MFLVMGITGKVGGATAEHLLGRGQQVRALVRDRARASSWADQGVELVDGDWSDAAAIERALKGVEGAFVMLPAVWAPSPHFKEAKGVIANYAKALTKAPPPRVVALSSMGANRTSGLGMITALSLLEQGFRDLISPIAFVRAGGFFENFLYGLQVARGGTLPVYYNPTKRKSTMVATNDIRAEVATLLTGPAWSGQRVVQKKVKKSNSTKAPKKKTAKNSAPKRTAKKVVKRSGSSLKKAVKKDDAERRKVKRSSSR